MACGDQIVAVVVFVVVVAAVLFAVYTMGRDAGYDAAFRDRK